MQILKETLRMYGAVFDISKRSPPGGITLNGYHIPEGTPLSVRILYLSVLITQSQCDGKLFLLLVTLISDVSSAPIL